MPSTLISMSPRTFSATTIPVPATSSAACARLIGLPLSKTSINCVSFSDATCRTNCKLAGCGDGILDSGEECDDSNTSNGDGCDASCQLESGLCGNSTLDPGEDCDDGNTTSGDGCSATCNLLVSDDFSPDRESFWVEVDPLGDTTFSNVGAGTADFCTMSGRYPQEADQRTLTTAGDSVDEVFIGVLVRGQDFVGEVVVLVDQEIEAMRCLADDVEQAL